MLMFASMAYKATAAVQRHIKEMRKQAKPLCAACTIKGGFRGLAGRPQGTNKMNEVKRSRGWGWALLPWWVELGWGRVFGRGLRNWLMHPFYNLPSSPVIAGQPIYNADTFGLSKRSQKGKT